MYNSENWTFSLGGYVPRETAVRLSWRKLRPTMELLVLGLIVLFFYAFIRLLASLSTWLTGARYRAYWQVAHRFGGRYESRGMSDPPTVGFQHNGTSVRVGLAPSIPGQAQNPRTRVVARFRQGIPFRLELAPVARPAPPQAPKGTRVVKSGDAEFDFRYLAQANDAEMARDFLSPSVRGAIEGLQRLVHPGGMLVSINPERLLVQVDRNLGRSNDGLCQAVSSALLIHDGLQAGVKRRMSQGISIMEGSGGPDPDAGPPICKICLYPIDADPVVICSRCRTPHHRECWDYNGGSCSIYGCGCKQAEPASPARP